MLLSLGKNNAHELLDADTSFLFSESVSALEGSAQEAFSEVDQYLGLSL